MEKTRTREQAIEEARRRVEKDYCCEPGERRWLVAAVDSYGMEGYRSEIHALEGSPPKGHVVVLSDAEFYGTVIAFSCSNRRIFSCEFIPSREECAF